MIYVIMKYWDFMILALLLGVAVGWWTQTGRGSRRRAAEEAGQGT